MEAQRRRTEEEKAEKKGVPGILRVHRAGVGGIREDERWEITSYPTLLYQLYAMEEERKDDKKTM